MLAFLWAHLVPVPGNVHSNGFVPLAHVLVEHSDALGGVSTAAPSVSVDGDVITAVELDLLVETI